MIPVFRMNQMTGLASSADMWADAETVLCELRTTMGRLSHHILGGWLPLPWPWMSRPCASYQRIVRRTRGRVPGTESSECCLERDKPGRSAQRDSRGRWWGSQWVRGRRVTPRSTVSCRTAGVPSWSQRGGCAVVAAKKVAKFEDPTGCW